MPLVTRLGPIPLRDASDTFVYVEASRGEISNLTIGRDDAQILSAVGEASPRGEPLECSLDLYQVGKRLGYRVATIPEDLFALIAGYAMGLAAGELHQPMIPAKAMRAFGYAAADFVRREPWKLWGGDEPEPLSVTVSGSSHGQFCLRVSDSPPGISLEVSSGIPAPEDDELVVALRADVPCFAQPWIEQAFGLRCLPVAGVPVDDGFEPVTLHELMTLSAVLRAVGELSPRKGRASATEALEANHVTVEIETPLLT